MHAEVDRRLDAARRAGGERLCDVAR